MVDEKQHSLVHLLEETISTEAVQSVETILVTAYETL